MRVLREDVKSFLVTIVSSRYFPILLALPFIIFTFLGIHGSSVGMYNKYFYGEEYIDKDLIFGTPRGIRSDEWLVLTPLTAAQARNNFTRVNENIGLGQEMPIDDYPALHWSTLFKPSNWGFFVVSTEVAFAFRWWFRAFLLLTAAYLLILLLTKKNYFLAISGSLLFFFTPFVQWWYSTSVLEIITYGFFIIYFFIKVFHFKNRRDLIVNSLLLTYFCVCYAFILYPPFQVSVGLFALFFLIGYVLNNLQTINKEKLKAYLIAGGAVLSMIVGVLLAYYTSFRDVIQIMLNTSYPGGGTFTGGGYNPARFFSGFFNIQLLDDLKTVPQILGNQSEASSFFMLFPFLLPLYLFHAAKKYLKSKKVDFVMIFISLFLILSCVWIFIGLPHIFSTITLLNRVANSRMIIGIGVANLLLLVYWLNSHKIPNTVGYKMVSLLVALFGLILHLYLGFYLKSNYPMFIGSSLEISLISAFAFLSIAFLLLQKQQLFIFTLLLYSILSSYRVNPLYKGLDPLINSELSKEIQQIEETNINGEKWVVYDTIILGNYLVANGANSINGVHFYPQLELWEKFDPQGEYYSIYNRYAHMTFAANGDKDAIEMILNQPDAFTVQVNPCNEVFDDLDVRYFVFNRRANYECLSEVAEVPYPSMPVYIFERL